MPLSRESTESAPPHGHPTPRPNARDAPYQLRGTFYEACDCYTICPCWTDGNPDEGECTGVFAWEIEAGSIDGVDVSGRCVVSVSQHAGARETAKQRVAIFVDDDATPQQTDLLAAVFSGNLGGTLQELADLLGEFLGVQQTPVKLRHEGRLTTLTVGKHILVEGTGTAGPSGRIMTLSDGCLSDVLGSPAQIGVSCRFRVRLPTHGMSLDLRGRSTMAGRFSYQHAPKSGYSRNRAPAVDLG